MLIAFRAANHRSIREEVELAMVRPGGATRSRSELRRSGLRVAAIYGANASGKSNILSAIQFMSSAVTQSHSRQADAKVPVRPFRLDPEYVGKPSKFEVDVIVNDTWYQYGFEATRERFTNEWLYVFPGSRRQVWFERQLDTFYFGRALHGRNRAIADLTRPNALFLSTAAASNHHQLLTLFSWFNSRLLAADTKDEPARMAFTRSQITKSERIRDGVAVLLKFADLGIRGVRVRKKEISEEERERIIARAREDLGDVGLNDDEWKSAFDVASSVLELEHVTAEGSTEALPFEDESLGTQALVALSGPLLWALANGATLVVDEIDTSMHPAVVTEIVRLFEHEELNSRGAQLLFSSHDVSLLGGALAGDGVLRREQIWFTEKGDDGGTRLYPLTDFRPRAEENFARGYLQGRYGAVPIVDRAALTSLANGGWEKALESSAIAE